jgi:glycosyltransferase involved in cell wall biosynthesis
MFSMSGDRRLRVLVLSDTFPPTAPGGAGAVAYELARGVQQAGAEVVAVSVHHQRGQGIVRDDLEFPIYRLFSQYPRRFVAYFGLWNPMTVPHVRQLLDEVRPDVVHAHNVHAHLSYASLGVARRHGLPVLLTAHDTMSFTYQKFTEFIDPQSHDVPTTFDYQLGFWVNLQRQRFRYFPPRNTVIRHVFRRYVDALVTPSHALRGALRANGIRAPRMEVVPNSIDLVRWHADADPGKMAAFRREHDLEGYKVLLFGGRVSRYKGGELLLQALQKVAERVTNVRLLILARLEGYASAMLERAASLGLADHVRLAGWLSSEELQTAYHVADLVTMPSIYLEPFGMIALEGMGAGVPVVATCFGGTPEVVIDGQTGYVVNPYNVEMLADRLVRLLQDDALAHQMGEAGRRRAQEHFSLESMVERTLALYEDVQQ